MNTKWVWVFPGQGSQKLGMGADLYAHSLPARSIFERADAQLGYSMSRLCFVGPEDELRQTIHTQPALFTTACAALAAFRSGLPNLSPFAVAGHSVGEYAALVASEAISFETGLSLVTRRAELMQEAALMRPGAMAAILGLDADKVRDACEIAARELGLIVSIANYNCPGQIVISGESAAVERASTLCKELGAKRAMTLPVSGAFHSKLMVGAGDALYPSLRSALIQNARVPVVTNFDAEYTRSGADFAPLLTLQVSGSVRWEESIRRLSSDGVTGYIEFGVGDVLCGLIRRIQPDAELLSVRDIATLNSVVDRMQADLAAKAEAAAAATALANSEASEPVQPPELVFVLAKRETWDSQAGQDAFITESLSSEGFIHASTRSQLIASADRHFRALKHVVAIEVATSALTSELRMDISRGGDHFPHIYGGINRAAIIAITPLLSRGDGRFAGLDEGNREELVSH